MRIPIYSLFIFNNWRQIIGNRRGIFNGSFKDKYEQLDRIILNNDTLFSNYDCKDYFKYVADVVINRDQSKQLLKFVPKISIEQFNEKREWIYLYLIEDRIIKIGGTRVGLQGRARSYLSGYYTVERGKSGLCSITNAAIYNLFNYSLEKGYKVKMYGYMLPKVETEIIIIDRKLTVPVQTYHIYEKIFIDNYLEKYKLK